MYLIGFEWEQHPTNWWTFQACLITGQRDHQIPNGFCCAFQLELEDVSDYKKMNNDVRNPRALNTCETAFWGLNTKPQKILGASGIPRQAMDLVAVDYIPMANG